MSEFASVALVAIFSSNVVAISGIGAISLQSEKRNFLYMLVSSMCIIVSVIIAGLAYFTVNEYILVPLNAEELKLFVVMLFCVLLAFASRAILKVSTKEIFFIYEKSYGLPIQTAVCIGTIVLVDFAQDFLMVMFELAMFCVGFLLVQLLFYAMYARLDNSYTLKPARNVPVMLYTLSIVSIILYAIRMFF